MFVSFYNIIQMKMGVFLAALCILTTSVRGQMYQPANAQFCPDGTT